MNFFTTPLLMATMMRSTPTSRAIVEFILEQMEEFL